MLLQQCIEKLKVLELIGSDAININNIQIDSRKVTDNTLFIAIKGTQTDGHKYITQAIKSGAKAIVCSTLPTILDKETTYIKVINTEIALGCIATVFYKNPTDNLKLIGVTGTNGKTTTATLLYDLFKALGYKTGLISTVCNKIGNSEFETSHTTPDAITLNRLLSKMVEAGCDYAFMEVSSHAIDQHRIEGLKFTGAVFTNLTRDHLDYHKTVENYIKAKKTFFDNLLPNAFSLVNIDDKQGSIMIQNTKSSKYAYSLSKTADFKAKILELMLDGMLLTINNKELFIRFTGKFNAYNVLAAYGTALLLNQNEEEVLLALSSLSHVAGRFETLKSPTGFTAIVDYAHTPDALENVLTTIREIINNKGSIITVCGAGGNRDKGKRPLMTKEALKYSDKVILTSDNPRFEEPQNIVKDMLEGINDSKSKAKILTILDRREAIKTACFIAQPNDVILVAGKGHENYQSIKGVNHHFDDKEELTNIFNTLQL